MMKANNNLVVFFDDRVLAILDCGDAVQDTRRILEWYADKFAFDLKRLTCQWSASVDVRDWLRSDLGL